MNRFEWLGFFGMVLVLTFLIYINPPFEFGKRVKRVKKRGTSVQLTQTFQPSQPLPLSPLIIFIKPYQPAAQFVLPPQPQPQITPLVQRERVYYYDPIALYNFATGMWLLNCEHVKRARNIFDSFVPPPCFFNPAFCYKNSPLMQRGGFFLH